MAPDTHHRHQPTTPHEAELLHDLAARLTALDLTAEIDLDRRSLVAHQPAVTGAGPISVGLSQTVYLTRHRTDPDARLWVLRLDQGFRGVDGAQYEAIAPGADVADVARRLGAILALVDQGATTSARAPVA